MQESLLSSLRFFAQDGDLDIEDVDHAAQIALEDGRISPNEAMELRGAIERYRAQLDPQALRYLEDLVAGRAPQLVNRTLLAPAPRGREKELYAPRADVVALQERIAWLGVACAIDGDFGPATTAALKQVQQNLGLPATGLLDSRTLSRMNRALGEAGRPALDLNPRARIRPDAVIAVKGAGDRARVKALQVALNAISTGFKLGWPALAEDGAFGGKTEEVVRLAQALVYLPATGLFDTSLAQALNPLLKKLGLTPLDERAPTSGGGHDGRVELHFYPGRHQLKVYVLKGGKVLDVYGMVGGEEGADRVSSSNPNVRYSETPAGRYRIEEISPHASGTWPRSYVPYGSELRLVDDEVQYRAGDGVWRFATGPRSEFIRRDPPPMTRSGYLNPDGSLPRTYAGNDFGHLRVYLRDLATGRLQTHMVHPIPDLEQNTKYWADTRALTSPSVALATLRYSHGCEHIHPRDLDEMTAKGYVAPGVIFVVHSYDDEPAM
ncbi:peptidoglycan-binding protein [Myxococcota bacterium]|nr:peptidoglycan-binding protein [Myxococcota bacterium]